MSVTCALCGARRRNDESVIWIGMSWEQRSPYCAGDCANRANPNTCVHEDHLALCKRCEDAERRVRARGALVTDDDRYKHVMCSRCFRVYVCRPADDHYDPAPQLNWTAGKVCMSCLMALARKVSP